MRKLLANKTVLIMSKALISIALLSWLISYTEIDWLKITNAVNHTSFWIGFACIFVNILGQAMRWVLALRIFGISLSLRPSIHITFISQFFQVATVGALGGEAARSHYLRKEAQISISHAAAASVLDRVIGLFTMSFIGIVGALFLMIGANLQDDTAMLLNISFITFATLIAMALAGYFILSRWSVFSSRYMIFFQQGIFYISKLIQNPKRTFYLLLCSGMTNILVIIGLVQFANVLGTDIGMGASATMVPPIMISNSLPISIGGLGVGEASAEGVFSLLHYANGAASMFLVRISLWFLGLIGGILFLFRPKSNP